MLPSALWRWQMQLACAVPSTQHTRRAPLPQIYLDSNCARLYDVDAPELHVVDAPEALMTEVVAATVEASAMVVDHTDVAAINIGALEEMRRRTRRSLRSGLHVREMMQLRWHNCFQRAKT